MHYDTYESHEVSSLGYLASKWMSWCQLVLGIGSDEPIYAVLSYYFFG